MWHVSAACFILLLTVPVSVAFTRLPLSGSGWIVSDSADVKINGKVPGTQYTALLKQGLIGDPLYRDNDVNLRSLGRKNWTYSLNFSVPAILVSSKNLTLVCEGLDTVAQMILNNNVLGKTDNMFVRFAYDITGKLRKGNNNLRVEFTSAVLEAQSKASKSSYRIPPDCPPEVQHGECHVNQLRKEQCSFSWDWGPSFPTQGIWQPIYIDSFNSAIIRDVSAVVSKVNNKWQIAVQVYFDSIRQPGRYGVTGQLEASIRGLNLSHSENVTLRGIEEPTHFIITVPESKIVPLWWPRGYGEQNLFTLNVTFETFKGPYRSATDKSSKSLRIGFRTVELIQEPVKNKFQIRKGWKYYYDKRYSPTGLTFYFRVNGIPIFLKGSNWIPADNFQERITRKHLQYLLSSAASVGINAMRVWGGGIYESDDLYDICDELGIMVWQDLMFSVALYPAYPEFIKSVAYEVKYQMRRLKHHASILVWAGSNENEKALRQDWFDTKENYTRYYEDFLKLYVRTIKPIVESEDSSREYLSSSPTNGAESVKEGYVAQDPGSELYGDIHFYDYMADQWTAEVFRIPRMASEYGIQSWCNNESLAAVFAPQDFDVNSKMVDHRQHHGMGNIEMTAEVTLHMQLPQTSDTQSYFAEYIYLTQINQAMSMRTQTEHYRRYQSRLLDDGRGLTMGALYWQLNDIWQAPTWASIDYEGRWKMLHYFARSFFNKHLISPYKLDSNTLDVFIVVDEIPIMESRSPATGKLQFWPMSTLDSLKNSEVPKQEIYAVLHKLRMATIGYLRIEVFEYSSFQPLFSWTVPYELKTTAESVFKKSISDALSESGCPGPEHCLLYFSATDQSGSDLSTSWFMFTYPKYARIKKPQLKIVSVTKLASTVFEIEVSADVPALFVWLSAGSVKGHFSDNGFHMLSSSAKVQFFAQQPIRSLTLRPQLSVKSLQNNWSNIRAHFSILVFLCMSISLLYWIIY
ncbi:hypothetical protein RRG08_017942 [Elysia crispata]|uniref:beta-mannosidase n=1 Tax=Elysia crispata TaxID=231223 RepID=A0AAE0Y331_9GAST|nr:hypothetical protein RRG08_017942 [Elysia crispata]